MFVDDETGEIFEDLDKYIEYLKKKTDIVKEDQIKLRTITDMLNKLIPIAKQNNKSTEIIRSMIESNKDLLK